MKKAATQHPLGLELKARLGGRDGVGRVRLSDDSMKAARVRKGDIVRVQLDAPPKQRRLCVAFTSWGELVVRRFYRKANGDIRLSTGAKGETFQVFHHDAVMIFGPVVGVEKRGGPCKN
jgi:SOS-response transcriptional repressor LexA